MAMQGMLLGTGGRQGEMDEGKCLRVLTWKWFESVQQAGGMRCLEIRIDERIDRIDGRLSQESWKEVKLESEALNRVSEGEEEESETAFG